MEESGQGKLATLGKIGTQDTSRFLMCIFIAPDHVPSWTSHPYIRKQAKLQLRVPPSQPLVVIGVYIDRRHSLIVVIVTRVVLARSRLSTRRCSSTSHSDMGQVDLHKLRHVVL